MAIKRNTKRPRRASNRRKPKSRLLTAKARRNATRNRKARSRPFV